MNSHPPSTYRCAHPANIKLENKQNIASNILVKDHFFEICSLAVQAHHIHLEVPMAFLQDGRASGAPEGQPSANAFFCLLVG